MIIKNCDNNKNYKITLYKLNQALIKDGSLKFWVEKYILQNISDIDNIESLKIKNNSNNLESINIGVESDIANNNTENNLGQLNILSNDENYDSSIRAIQNSRLIIKMSECDIFSASNKIDIIPELFFNKRNLLIMKNINDNKCFYIVTLENLKMLLLVIYLGLVKKI